MCNFSREYRAPVDLTLTGERTVPGIPAENYWFRRHEAAYTAVARFVARARVLDAGAGEGYGAAALPADVIALDYDAAVTAHLRSTYPHVAVVRGNLVHLPFRDDSLDAIVSLQVIEHLWDPEAFLRECARVVGPAGTLIIGTPNRLTFPPGNPFHSKEFTAAELMALLDADFIVGPMLGVHHGQRLRRLDRRWNSLVDAQLRAPAEAWPAELLRDVAAVAVTDFVVTEHDLDASLDLLVVATRR